MKSNNIPLIDSIQQHGLYSQDYEHDSCGVGLVANIDGKPSHSILSRGIEVLRKLGHRGASGADPDTGDGAGVLLQMPHEFLTNHSGSVGELLGRKGEYAVGVVFLPQESGKRNICEQILRDTIVENGINFIGWRDVPVNPSAIGQLAQSVMPLIRHFFVERPKNISNETQFELYLYFLRKQIESAINNEGIAIGSDFYIPSFSSNRLVYKGLLKSDQLESFYEDLGNSSMETPFALVHSRFSTNTLGTWNLAHPYRLLIHNGEINTLRGNINWMTAREPMFTSTKLEHDVKQLLPVILPNQSDTAALDNALELLIATGRPIEHAMMMLVPEAWGDHIPMDPEKQNFYKYHSSMMEPWDGPALLIGTDGNKICAVLDRNGLRPCRYMVTTDNVLVMASETGVFDIPTENIVLKDRIYPGKMFLLDLNEGKLIGDSEIKSRLSSQHPYGEWLETNSIHLDDLASTNQAVKTNLIDIEKRQGSFGYTIEDINLIIQPMAEFGEEAIGSMGNDAPLAVLSDKNPPLFSYFKQLFAQVSNPPLDAIREKLVTSLELTCGRERNLFDQTPEHCAQLRLASPIITNEQLTKIRDIDVSGIKSKTISTLFKVKAGRGSLENSMDRICKEASEAIKQGYEILILSDKGVNSANAPVPSLLATAGVHHHLIREGSRSQVGLVVQSGEPREVAHFALLIGYGAAAINPYMVFESLDSINKSRLARQTKLTSGNYIKAANKGILKIMSKMGISTLQAYRGAQIFEAVGLRQNLVDKYFTWTSSRIGGIGIEDIEHESLTKHHFGFETSKDNGLQVLDEGGIYQWRRNGEYHMWNPDTIANLQKAVRTGDFSTFEQFATHVDDQNEKLCTIRGLLDFKKIRESIPIDEVEPAKEIVKRFASGAISLGSISREAHETLAIAANRIGARSNTGEGGEDYHRYVKSDNGDSRNSAIKQVASGRFGVTIDYLSNAHDLQIKMAQGSKPGEGGQLPGHKVDEYIGWVRNSTPGVELISPPPHHDIYSIEDLAQLIHDLKNANPQARIHVKLVAEAGVGTIAAGVSKAKADVVLISGDSGGTGASPESSIKNAGLPWELGVAETQQVLVANNLRGRIVVQTDGQLKTGRDVAIACLLGAEEFGFATAPLISMGCIMLRKCHLNTCSVGIATQDAELRKQFSGQPEHVINYFFFVAEQVRTIMAELGLKSINEMVGRTDMLDKRKISTHWKTDGLDFSKLLYKLEPPKGVHVHNSEKQDHGLDQAIDNRLIKLSDEALNMAKAVSFDMKISNKNRTVGTMLSNAVTKKHGAAGLPVDCIKIAFNGSAGQSFGAFLAPGISFNLTGDANDYFCKGLSGGKVSLKPPMSSAHNFLQNIIVGNVALYGATSGSVFIRGVAGERFAVRNSGAMAVVEGVGDHGCEYMTRGVVVILGPTGRNFASGMTGGEAFVLDEESKFDELCNKDFVELETVESSQDKQILKDLLESHYTITESPKAKEVLENFESFLKSFVKVMPTDYKRILESKKQSEANSMVN